MPGVVRRTFLPVFIALVLVGLVIGWLVGMSVGPWPATLSLAPRCSLELIVRGTNNTAVPDAIVEIAYLNRLYLGETSAAGRYTWRFPCKGDAQSRFVVDAPGYATYAAAGSEPGCESMIVREPYPDGREDLVFETFIPQGNGQTQVIASGATGSATAGWCDDLKLFNSSLQDYWVEIRYAAGMMGD